MPEEPLTPEGETFVDRGPPSTSRYRDGVPELPQMQALSERLDAAVGGLTLEGYEPIGFSNLKTVVPAPEALVGRTLEHVGRRGKYVSLEFGDAGPHPRAPLAGGPGRPRGAAEEDTRQGRGRPPPVRRRRRAAGSACSCASSAPSARPRGGCSRPGDDGPLEKLGPEPDTDEFAELILHGDDGRRVHTILRDQRTVTGVGRGYADDALWRAQLSPYASLDVARRRRAAAPPRRGPRRASPTDSSSNASGPAASARTSSASTSRSTARHGTPCPRCGETLRRVSYESYEVTYCPACQTGGKVLADRRLSRLVEAPDPRLISTGSRVTRQRARGG